MVTIGEYALLETGMGGFNLQIKNAPEPGSVSGGYRPFPFHSCYKCVVLNRLVQFNVIRR